jgi:septal ring factor EnvC (AmiA/AmiB activator)
MAARKTKAADAAAEAPTTEAPATELIKLPDISAEKAPSIFGHNTLNQFVELARAAVINEVPDLSTDKGRKRIASVAATVARSKTAVDAAGRAYLKKLKEMTKPIEAELRQFETDMDALRDEVRAPLNEWQALRDAEEDRLQDAIDQVVARFTLAADVNADEIQGALFGLEQEPLTVEVFGHRLEEAETKRAYGITVLTEQLAKRQQYENEQAELVENRRKIAQLEEEKRIKDAAELAVKEERERNEKQQQEQRDADAKRVRDAEDTARRAKQDVEDANQRAEDERVKSQQRADQAAADARQKVLDDQAEKDRQAQATIDQQRRDDEARAANRAHCGAINKAALDALVLVNLSGDEQPESFMSQAEAKAIISAIIRGQIPAIAITY